MKRVFAPCDLIVYFLIVAIVGFAAFWGRGERGEEYLVSIDGARVCLIRKNGARIEEEWKNRVTQEERKGVLILTIDTGGGGYNVIEAGGGEVKMQNANCSRHKDCTRMLPLSEKSGTAIVCAPHKLKIEPVKKQITPIAG